MGSIEGILAAYGVPAVFLASLIENLGLPLPVFPLIVLAGAVAASGALSLPSVLSAAILGALAGDLAWFLAGRWRGKKVLFHLCRLSFNPDACLERAVDGFHRRKILTILSAKFLPGINTIMPPLAGVSPMPLAVFLGLDFLGALFWAGSAAGLGWSFGEELAASAHGFQDWMKWILPGGIAASVAWRAAFRYYLVHRFSAPRIDPEELRRKMEEGADLIILDLRRDHDYDTSDSMIAGALRVRPASFHRVAHHLPRDRDLVFYCT